jgi:hypothetical protein
MNASASAIVLFIFQLPAMNGVRLLTRGLHAGQRLALDELQRRAAARREVVDAVREAELRERRGRVAAAHDRRARRAAIASATARVPAANGSSSNAPIGPFQNTVPASAITSRSARRCARRRRGPSSRRDVDAVELAALGVGLELARRRRGRRAARSFVRARAALRAGSTPPPRTASRRRRGPAP